MTNVFRLLFLLLVLTVVPDETRDALLRLDVRRLDVWLSVAGMGIGFFVLIPESALWLAHAYGLGAAFSGGSWAQDRFIASVVERGGSSEQGREGTPGGGQ